MVQALVRAGMRGCREEAAAEGSLLSGPGGSRATQHMPLRLVLDPERYYPILILSRHALDESSTLQQGASFQHPAFHRRFVLVACMEWTGLRQGTGRKVGFGSRNRA